MIKTLVVFFSVLFIAFLIIFDKSAPLSFKNNPLVLKPTSEKEENKNTLLKKSIFVPYWALGDSQDIDKYNELIYFGIKPDEDSINNNDEGFRQLAQFDSIVHKDQKKFLTLRMLDSKNNFTILADERKQKRIIDETITIAKKHNFHGIILDLELSALPFQSVLNQINSFTKTFSTESKKNTLAFGMTLYGDTFYRIRPFDVKNIAQSVDFVMIMAYDLHKAGGNPGPNFPLSGKEVYGYDYSGLVDNFSSEVPKEKIIVIFGMFGYDWTVDEKNISQQIAKPRSYLDITNSIVNKCAILKCKISRDTLSGETKIQYTAEDNSKHVVWYEDMKSTTEKQQYLQKKGISNFSYWAYSYF